jgi:hypothetical protein
VASVRGGGDVRDVASVWQRESVTWRASAARATWQRDKRDVMSGTWETSPPFHMYSRTWDWYPGRGRTPEKRGDVRDVKRGRYLLVHFFQITGIVRIVRALEVTAARWCPRAASSASGNLAADFDHNFDGKKFFLTWCPVQDLVLRSLQQLATRADGCRPCREKEDTTTTTATTTMTTPRTTPFLQSPPAALRQGIARIVFSRTPGLHEGRRGVLLMFLDSTFGLDRRHPTESSSHPHFHFALRILAKFTQGGGGEITVITVITVSSPAGGQQLVAEANHGKVSLSKNTRVVYSS